MPPTDDAPTYDLGFWREAEGADLDDQQVYARLCAGEEVAGLERIDAGAIVRGFAEALPDHERAGVSSWSDGRSSFTAYRTDQHVRVDCEGLSGEEMERLIAVAVAHGCLVYDPQEGERREG